FGFFLYRIARTNPLLDGLQKRKPHARAAVSENGIILVTYAPLCPWRYGSDGRLQPLSMTEWSIRLTKLCKKSAMNCDIGELERVCGYLSLFFIRSRSICRIF